MSETGYECLDCGKQLNPDERVRPNCGSAIRHVHVSVSNGIRMREGIKGKVKDAVGKTKRKFLSREKISKLGKEAREELSIDIAGNRKFHHVEEQDESGKWVTVHHENEPLRKKRKNG